MVGWIGLPIAAVNAVAGAAGFYNSNYQSFWNGLNIVALVAPHGGAGHQPQELVPLNRPNGTGGAKASTRTLVDGKRIADDHTMGGDGRTQDGSAKDDDGLDGTVPVVDEVTGLANRRGFLEILRLEERRHARYGGSPILVLIDVRKVLAECPLVERGDLLVEIAAILADCIRDTDTLARIDDNRFAILAIQAGCSASSIVGRLRLHLELRRIHQAEVTVGESGGLGGAWQALEGSSSKPALRLVRSDEAGF